MPQKLTEFDILFVNDLNFPIDVNTDLSYTPKNHRAITLLPTEPKLVEDLPKTLPIFCLVYYFGHVFLVIWNREFIANMTSYFYLMPQFRLFSSVNLNTS